MIWVGHQTFARKMTWCIEFCPPKKSIGFSVQIKVVFKKKRSSRHRLFYLFPTFLLVFKKKGRVKEGLGGHAEHFRGAKLPKFFTRDRHLKTKGGAVPPAPPPLSLWSKSRAVKLDSLLPTAATFLRKDLRCPDAMTRWAPPTRYTLWLDTANIKKIWCWLE